MNAIVSVIKCNVRTFIANYREYIAKGNGSVMGTYYFAVSVPQEVYNEITGLTEEGIEIA